MGHGLALFALTLTLGLQAPVEPRQAAEHEGHERTGAVDGIAVEGSATQGARARPLYDGVREQCKRLSSNLTSAAATTQLERWLSDWREKGFGLEGEVDADQALASVTALAGLAWEHEHAEELLLLLTVIPPKLDELGGSEPDLALALGLGWLALTAAPMAEEIPVEERAAGLELALRAAEAIDAADQRDAFGLRLAHELYRHLRAAERGAESAEMLEDALARFPGDPDTRPYLLATLSDERRARGEFEPAWRSLSQSDEAYRALRARAPEADLCVLERALAGGRCQLELSTGLLDRAALSLELERRAVEAGANDADSVLGLLLNVSGVALASARPYALRRALEELEKSSGPTSSIAARPAYAAKVRARAALIQDVLAEIDAGEEERAAELLRASFEDAALDETHRSVVGLRLFALAVRRRDLEAAGAWLARLEADPARSAERAPELAVTLATSHALLALERGAGEEDLRAHAQALHAEYKSFLGAFHALPEREGGLGYLGWRYRRLLLGTLVDLSLALDGSVKGAERAIDLLLEEQALGSLARRLDCKPGSLAEARAELLTSGVGLLLYSPAGTSTHVFCVDETGIVHDEVPWAYELEVLPKELSDLLSASPSRLSDRARAEELEKIHGAARELSRRLLPEPIAKRLATWRSVYLVGAERLGDVPFECVPLEGEPLGTRLALAHLPSLPVGLELARRARAREAEPEASALELLLVAAPRTAASSSSAHPNLVPIPFDEEDRAALCAPFERALVLTGAEAQWSRVQAELARARVLHFLVHGVTDPERELSGGLALAPGPGAPDGLLWCEQLFRTEFTSPPLVILSACGSARGPKRSGDDGLSQLGGAFLSRGARCTVQAVGDIALDSTLKLMETFTRELARGVTPAEAMRLARTELGGKTALTRDPKYAHPFYTCSLRVVGLGFAPVFEARER